ncbi:Down syndrome cell adhesion molecule-like protein Dscam2 [Aricia agestis]|uniref:Down syndrome cell adhesion molecule-like protein Dscam2 n=1 Tax=Aricia agestis TaxID=91739 RepID=UPI001C20BF3F|nr:Down syndrome cell adhesion molecule-like protein Dscam2 [Aricia agestis]
MNSIWIIAVLACCNVAITRSSDLYEEDWAYYIYHRNRSSPIVPAVHHNGILRRDNGTHSLDKYTLELSSNNYKYTTTRSDLESFIELIKTNGRPKRSLVSGNIMITQHFNEKLISPGEDISLQCTATADRPPRFIWERDGVVLTSNTDSRYILGQVMSPIGIGVVSQLNISRPRVEDGGLYSCIAYEGDSNVKYSARINIYGPPYIRTLPPIKVLSGEGLKLRCPYYGYPISKLEWEHKGKKLVTSILPQHMRYKRTYTIKHINTRKRRRKRQVLEGNEDGVLSLHRVLKEENGDTYTCIVYSPSGEMARRSFEIQVVEAPELDELRVGSGLKEGQIVQITCNIISGDPPIFFSWLKDGMKIPASLKITERSSELFSVLIIKRVSLEHCGRYTCIATNHVGKVNQTTDLYINVAPKWVEEPTNASLLLGQRGIVDCNANGYPVPQIHWMKRDTSLGIWRPILDLAGGGVSSYPNGSLSLEVVSLADEGEYACHVNNGFGDPLHKNLWISVNKPVHFESVGTNITTKMGHTVTITCQPLGDSPIRIKWSLDGKPVEMSSARVTLSETASPLGLQSTLSIKHAESRDRGTYECRASNPFGVSTYNVFLNILEPPVPPVDLQVDSVTSSTAKLSWRDTFVSQVQYYSIQYSNNHYALWDSAKLVNVTRQTNDIRQSVELRDLQPALDYRVRVAAGNLVDLSPYTQPVHFSTLQEAPSASPLGVQVQQTDNPGELLVSWIPPSKESHNGPLQGYHVKAVPLISGESGSNGTNTKIIKMSSRNGKHETVLSGLLKNTRYAVTVSAFNSAGNGPFSIPVYQTTREGAPEEAVSGVVCGGAAAGALRVSWPPLAPRAASLLGYVLLYSTDDGPWSNVTSPHSEIYLQGLQKYTNYTIKVAGFSNYGVGPFSYPVVCTTLQDVPGAPPVIKALASSPTSMIVSWKVPDEPNGEITHYTVYVKPVSSTGAPQSYRVEPTQESLSTRQLKFALSNISSGAYEVFVRAHTAAGEGAPSARVHVELTNKVVAGVWSLGGRVWAGAGGSLRLACAGAGSPPPRALWYHDHNIITHHPRFTRQQDGGLLVHNIDQSLSGNYTCIAKNLYGSDSVSYEVMVLPTPEPPVLRVTSHKNALFLQWDQPKKVTGKPQKITYELTWREANGSWQDTWTDKGTQIQGVQEYTLDGLKCGTKYSLRMIASNSVGSSTPTQIDAYTLGGVPKAPSTTEWFWSNATHIFIQLSGWDDNGCEITRWEIHYREYGGKMWKRVESLSPLSDPSWNDYMPVLSQLSSLAVSGLNPAQWYQIRVMAENAAGVTTSLYSYATTTLLGAAIGPPSEYMDINMLVIVFSSILLVLCSLIFLYILIKRHNHHRLTEYRNSLTTEIKSERSNVTVNTPQSLPSDNNRVYSTPVHLTAENKHELYEISPYAQFALGFRTFGHVDNQEAPSRMHFPSNSKARYDSETSFQMRSESEESDYVSRTTTLKSAPRKACRIPHHR